MAAIPPGTRQCCSVCGVEILGLVGGSDQVLFSHGTPGSRAKLWARVCQYLRDDDKQRQCLNQDAALRGTVQSSDFFAEAPAIDLGQEFGGQS